MNRLTTVLCRTAIVAFALACCTSPALASVRLLVRNVDWVTVGTVVQFHLRFDNPDATPSLPVSGALMPQAFGAFAPSTGQGSGFDVPAMAAYGFFDVFLEIPLAQLPQNPPNVVPGGGAAGGPCPPDNHWDGNVDITWGGSGGVGEVHRHVGRLRVCPGAGCSLIHLVVNCASAATWSVGPLCPGFHVTLLNEDKVTPAPTPLPGGWTGYACVTADAPVPVPTTCCFTLQFGCSGQVALVELCAVTCSCNATGSVPQPSLIEWTTVSPDSVRFHVRWTNPSTAMSTAPGSGSMSSQEFGVFLQDVGPIGTFNLPAIAPGSFFDVFTEVALGSLPANPPTAGGPAPNGPCPPVTHWNGNVDITWNTPAGGGVVQKHIGDIVVCPGSGASLIHIKSLLCGSALGMPWSVTGLCPGFSATLVNEDFTAAPNPVPFGWTGFINITASASTPVPDTCCFKVTFLCDGVPGVIDLCAHTCNCNQPGVPPQPGTVEWATLPGTNTVRFHVRWLDPDMSLPTTPGTGAMHSQMFGAFLPDFGTIGQFDLPAIQAGSFFDVFFDVPTTALPPSAQKVLSGGGPSPAGSNCPQDNHWDGNVDVTWIVGAANGGHVNRHYGTVLLNSAGSHGFIHVISGCTAATGTPWSLSPVCPGFTAVLLNQDYSLAPNPLPPGWTGWLSLGAAGTPVGATCCVDLTLHCAGASATIHVCATTCNWGTAGVNPTAVDLAFGIRAVMPNPTNGAATIGFVLSRAGIARLEVFDAAGHRVRSVADGMFGPGGHSVIWDGRDANGKIASPGEYFIRLTTAQQSATHKLVLRQ